RDLHTEVRCDSFGGSGDHQGHPSQGLSYFDDVPCGNVLHRAWHHDRRNNRRRARSSGAAPYKAFNAKTTVVLLLVLGILVGCRQGGTDVSTTRSSVAPLELAGQPGQVKSTAATWAAQYAKL